MSCRTVRGAPTLALAALLVAGCGDDALSPREVAGTYALRTYDGRPLPYQLGGTAGSGFTSADAERLVLASDGTLVRTRLLVRGPGYSNYAAPPDTTEERLMGTWALAGRTLTLTFGSGAGTAVTRRGSVTGAGLQYADSGLTLRAGVQTYADVTKLFERQ